MVRCEESTGTVTAAEEKQEAKDAMEIDENDASDSTLSDELFYWNLAPKTPPLPQYPVRFFL